MKFQKIETLNSANLDLDQRKERQTMLGYSM